MKEPRFYFEIYSILAIFILTDNKIANFQLVILCMLNIVNLLHLLDLGQNNCVNSVNTFCEVREILLYYNQLSL